jgi:hypothetical protein
VDYIQAVEERLAWYQTLIAEDQDILSVLSSAFSTDNECNNKGMSAEQLTQLLLIINEIYD